MIVSHSHFVGDLPGIVLSVTALPSKVSTHLVPAMLLALTGGGVDALVYLHHGHVFAAAMTGNGVLFGADVLNHDASGALHRLIPLAAFLLGVGVALLLERRLRGASILFGLSGEVLVVFAAAWLPASFPNPAFVGILAFALAYQVGAFRRVDRFAYNSTFITGDLRSAIDGLAALFDPKTRADGWVHFRDLVLIVLAFLVGAACGAVLSNRFGNRALMLLDLPLMAVLAFVVRRHVLKRAAGYGLCDEPTVPLGF